MGRKGSQRRSPTLTVAVAGVVIAVAIGGFWLVYRQSRPPAEGPAAKPASPPPAAGPSVETRRKVKIYVMNIVNNEPRLVPVTRSVPPGADPHAAAIQRLLATNHEVGPSQYLIPLGTKLLGLKVEKRIAYASFSREIKDNFSGGSMNEALLLNSIIHTLTQFRDVDKVQILVEGKKVDTLGGHLDISEPAAPDSTLLGQGETE